MQEYAEYYKEFFMSQMLLYVQKVSKADAASRTFSTRSENEKVFDHVCVVFREQFNNAVLVKKTLIFRQRQDCNDSSFVYSLNAFSIQT